MFVVGFAAEKLGLLLSLMIFIAMISICFLEVLSSEVWQAIGSFQDPELSRLARALPETVMKARADSTTKKYLGAFRTWAAGKSGLTAFPIEVAQFALFLQQLGETTRSKAAVEEAVNAVSWVQRLAGQVETSKNNLTKSVVEGFQCQLAQPRRKKEPITPEMLQEIVASMKSESLTEVRLATICLLAYAAFLRFDEINKVRCKDVSITGDKLEISFGQARQTSLGKVIVYLLLARAYPLVLCQCWKSISR